MNLSSLRRRATLKNLAALAQARLGLRPDAGSPLWVMSSLPRSGTHWLKRMISHAIGVDPLERRVNGADPVALIDALETHAARRLVYDHFDFDLHGGVLTPARFPRLKLITLYRHPVDALISQFYTRAARGTLPHPTLSVTENVRLHLADTTTPHDGNPRFREYVRRRVVGWLETGYTLPVRYEDLVEDAPGQLERVLDYLEIPATPAAVAKAVDANRFEILSGGRAPGEVDPSSHYRRGVPGEWREALTADERAGVERLIGDYLAVLGYPAGVAS